MSFISSKNNDWMAEFMREGYVSAPTPQMYVQAIADILESIQPGNQSDSKRIAVAKEHLKKLRSGIRKMEEKMLELEQNQKRKKI